MYKRKLYLGIIVLGLLTLIAGACSGGAEDTVTLKDTSWVLESYGAQGNLQTVLVGTEITVKFDRAEDRIHGSSGCNTYGGTYHISGNELLISDLYNTEMACFEPEGVMEQEGKYLNLLRVAESYQIQNGTLQIDSGGQKLIFSAKP
ncbi:META domain-containing protein [Chloroflexota bacterium]